MSLTKEEVHNLFGYYEGSLYWLDTGKEAGSFGGTLKHPRNKININGTFYYRYQLIFLYHYGFIPKRIDHINRDTLDDRIENLREVTNYQNSYNSSIQEGTSVYKGVYLHKQRSKWAVQIRCKDETRLSLGLYYSELNAALTYLCYSKIIQGEYASLELPEILRDINLTT